MECKLCGRERPIHKNFKTASRIKICDDCLETFDIADRNLREEVYNRLTESMNRRISNQVQSELPKVIEDLMIKSDITFELTVR